MSSSSSNSEEKNDDNIENLRSKLFEDLSYIIVLYFSIRWDKFIFQNVKQTTKLFSLSSGSINNMLSDKDGFKIDGFTLGHMRNIMGSIVFERASKLFINNTTVSYQSDTPFDIYG